MGLFKKDKQPETIQTGPPISCEMPGLPNVIKADLNPKRETKEVVVRDVSAEIDRFERGIEDRLGAIEAVLEQHEEKLNRIINFLNSAQQPRL